MWPFYFHTFNLKSHFFFYPGNIFPHYFLNSFLLSFLFFLFRMLQNEYWTYWIHPLYLLTFLLNALSLCSFFSFAFRLPWHQFPTLVFFSFLWLLSVTCGILVPQLGIEPLPPALEGQSPNHWTLREAPNPCLFDLLFYFISDLLYQIRSDQLLSRVRLFATPWIAA